MKQCTECKIIKSNDEFQKHKVNKNGSICYKAKCKMCLNSKRKEKWYSLPENVRKEKQRKVREKLGEDYFRNYKLKKKYGISLEDYNSMLEHQNGKCAICKTDLIVGSYYKNGGNCRVDHNHQTGKVRELVCHECNAVLGFSKENIDILQNTMNYLRKHT